MTESVKQRLGGSHIGKMNDKELRKIFLAIQSDLTALRTSVSSVQADGNNIQVVVNNLVLAVTNVRATVNNLVTDIVKVNCNTNAPNNTAPITATAVTINLNAITMSNAEPPTLNTAA